MTTRTRPKDRRQQIVRAATQMMSERGYDQVSMGDIAEAVGIVPSALYRHFASRQDLLQEVVMTGVAPTRALLEENGTTQPERLIDELVGLTQEHLALSVLWRRESRHLDPAHRDTMRREIREIGDLLTSMVRRGRPDLDDVQSELIAWCLFAVVLSTSGPHRELTRPRNAALVAELCHDVMSFPVQIEPRRSLATTGIDPSSRRERILSSAATLFAERGYSQVSVDEIGGMVGIAGPSVYNHVDGKLDLLDTLLCRVSNHLRYAISLALKSESSARTALDTIVGVYIDLAVRSPELVGLLVTEVEQLEGDSRREVLDTIRDLVREMAVLITSTHDVSIPDATLRVYAALTMISDIARTPSLSQRFEIADPLRDLARRLVLITP